MRLNPSAFFILEEMKKHQTKSERMFINSRSVESEIYEK
jgi:hypothetical protein